MNVIKYASRWDADVQDSTCEVYVWQEYHYEEIFC